MDISNAPKKQPCPECGAWAKRVSRTPQLATYFHKHCNISFMESLRPNRRNVAIIKRLRQLELRRRAQKMARVEEMQVHPEGPAEPFIYAGARVYFPQLSWWQRLKAWVRRPTINKRNVAS